MRTKEEIYSRISEIGNTKAVLDGLRSGTNHDKYFQGYLDGLAWAAGLNGWGYNSSKGQARLEKFNECIKTLQELMIESVEHKLGINGSETSA